MKTVLLQPSYIPWRGVFHQIFKSDLFIHFDDAQYDKHGWRNRNIIRNKNGLQWLTIPVLSKGNVEHRLEIKDIKINHSVNWLKKHWQSIEQSYSRAKYFNLYAAGLKAFYEKETEFLAEFTIPLLELLASLLGISHVKYLRSSTLNCQGSKTDKIINILNVVGSKYYISGPSAQNYLDAKALEENKISLEYMKYGYEKYPAPCEECGEELSILDLLFHFGPEACGFIWGHEKLPQKVGA